MSEEASFPERPRTVSHLTSLVDRYAKAHGLASGRVRKSLSYTIIAAALERVRSFDEASAFIIKGGVALERRLERPRTTKDMDVIYRDPGGDLLDALDKAFSEPYDGWSLRRDGEPEVLEKAVRVNVKLGYQGKSWGTVPLEVSEPEGALIPPERLAAFDLRQFGLNGPETIAALPIRRQMAQKMHGMTEVPSEGRENRRFRDLLDLWRFGDQGKIPVDREMRSECIQVFRRRRMHTWPPTIVVYPSWHASLRSLSERDGISFPGADEAAVEIRTLLESIDALAERVFAREYSEIPDILKRNTDLRDIVHALVESEPILEKALQGGSRLMRFVRSWNG